MKAMPVSYHRILMKLEGREKRWLARKQVSLPISLLEEKIPPAVREGLEKAFLKAFRVMLGEGGTRVVELTCRKEKLAEQAALWDLPLSPQEARQELKRLENRGRTEGLLNGAASGTEGALLGALGIGLPDIPIVLAQLLRSLYRSAGRYGFSWDTPEERQYLLLVLRTAVAGGEERRELSRRADAFGRALDHGWPVEVDDEGETVRAARSLSLRLLTVKFIQGFPLVGAVGGLSNWSISGSVARWGEMKYRKRFLERKVRGL